MWFSHLDITEGGTAALCQGLDNHERWHQVVLLHVAQHFHYLSLAVVFRGKVGECLHPQVRVFVSGGRGEERREGERGGGGGRGERGGREGEERERGRGGRIRRERDGRTEGRRGRMEEVKERWSKAREGWRKENKRLEGGQYNIIYPCLLHVSMTIS